jgi:restriction endonuclease Mrr
MSRRAGEWLGCPSPKESLRQFRQHKTNIECKTHTSPVGVRYVRQLRGVIERQRVNRGVLVAIGTFTRGARLESNGDSRLELLDGAALVQLLNANFGPDWVENRDRICWGMA